MSEVKVSVIMGVSGREEIGQLRAAIDSIVKQTLSEWEFIIFQDGYEAKTRAILAAIAAQEERIVLLGEENNHGLAYALNCCLKVANGKYIARMDADDIAKEERLQIQYEFLEKNPEYAFCGTNAELLNENGVWGKREMPQTPEKEDYLPYSPYIHPSVMFRRETLDACHGYSTAEQTLRCEDYDLFIRLYILGKKGYNIQQCLLQYREDRMAYRKRKYRYRWNECRVRHYGFRKMGIRGAKKFVYTIKPLIVGLMPVFVMQKSKLHRDRWEVVHEKGKAV